MNGIGVRGGASPKVQEEQLARLEAFAKGDDRLRDWRGREYWRLAGRFDPLADIPLRVWQAEWPPDLEASVDAFARLLGQGPDSPPSAELTDPEGRTGEINCWTARSVAVLHGPEMIYRMV